MSFRLSLGTRVVGAGLPAKNVNDNAALSGGPCRLRVFREQARSYGFRVFGDF